MKHNHTNKESSYMNNLSSYKNLYLFSETTFFLSLSLVLFFFFKISGLSEKENLFAISLIAFFISFIPVYYLICYPALNFNASKTFTNFTYMNTFLIFLISSTFLPGVHTLISGLIVLFFGLFSTLNSHLLYRYIYLRKQDKYQEEAI